MQHINEIANFLDLQEKKKEEEKKFNTWCCESALNELFRAQDKAKEAQNV